MRTGVLLRLVAAMMWTCLTAGSAAAFSPPMVPLYGAVTYAADCTPTDKAYTDDMLELARIAVNSNYFEQCVTTAMTDDWIVNSLGSLCSDTLEQNVNGPYLACSGDPAEFEPLAVQIATALSWARSPNDVYIECTTGTGFASTVLQQVGSGVEQVRWGRALPCIESTSGLIEACRVEEVTTWPYGLVCKELLYGPAILTHELTHNHNYRHPDGINNWCPGLDPTTVPNIVGDCVGEVLIQSVGINVWAGGSPCVTALSNCGVGYLMVKTSSSSESCSCVKDPGQPALPEPVQDLEVVDARAVLQSDTSVLVTAYLRRNGNWTFGGFGFTATIGQETDGVQFPYTGLPIGSTTKREVLVSGGPFFAGDTVVVEGFIMGGISELDYSNNVFTVEILGPDAGIDIDVPDRILPEDVNPLVYSWTLSNYSNFNIQAVYHLTELLHNGNIVDVVTFATGILFSLTNQFGVNDDLNWGIVLPTWSCDEIGNTPGQVFHSITLPGGIDSNPANDSDTEEFVITRNEAPVITWSPGLSGPYLFKATSLSDVFTIPLSVTITDPEAFPTDGDWSLLGEVPHVTIQETSSSTAVVSVSAKTLAMAWGCNYSAATRTLNFNVEVKAKDCVTSASEVIPIEVTIEWHGSFAAGLPGLNACLDDTPLGFPPNYKVFLDNSKDPVSVLNTICPWVYPSPLNDEPCLGLIDLQALPPVGDPARQPMLDQLAVINGAIGPSEWFEAEQLLVPTELTRMATQDYKQGMMTGHLLAQAALIKDQHRWNRVKFRPGQSASGTIGDGWSVSNASRVYFKQEVGFLPVITNVTVPATYERVPGLLPMLGGGVSTSNGSVYLKYDGDPTTDTWAMFGIKADGTTLNITTSFSATRGEITGRVSRVFWGVVVARIAHGSAAEGGGASLMMTGAASEESIFGVALATPGLLSEVDSELSCAGSCGFKAPAGCYCDELCMSNGDCCPDACAACGACE